MDPIVAGSETRNILPESVRQDIRVLPTEELLYQRELMGFVALDSDDVSAAIAMATHEAINAEIGRRRRLVERHKDSPFAPQWPDTGSKRYQDLLAKARDLKTLWPVETFVTQVLGVQLKRAGARLVGSCPLPGHRDSTPSFTVYPGDDRWHCFGCGEGGDIFELVGLCFGLERFRDRVQRVEDATPGLAESAS